MTGNWKAWRLALLLFFLCGGAFSTVCAKTAALWKLDYSPYTGINARCLVNPTNDFDVIIQGQQKEPPSSRPALPSGLAQEWSPLPPNPDTTAGLLDTTFSTNAVYYPHGMLFVSAGVTPFINSLTHSFTVEGWHYRDTTQAPPGIGAYLPFFSLGSTWADGGWSFGFYNLDDTNNLHFALYDYNDRPARRVFGTPIPTATYYKKWCHYALVYDHEGGGGLGTWEIFVNSASYGVVTNLTAPTKAGTQTTFCLGGDAGGSQYYNMGAYDTWRISDLALAPNQFLNAGTPTMVRSPTTLAFYRLDLNADGTLDLSNRVANAYHLQAPVGNSLTQVTANADQSVTSVPNPDASAHFFGRRSFNSGSISFRTGATSGSRSHLLSTNGLSKMLGATNSWTVETWINLKDRSGRQVFFSTKGGDGSGADGWMLCMNTVGVSGRYCLFTSSPPGVFLAFPGSTGSETTLNEWHHLALTYTTAAGPGLYGAWECFLDSESLGKVEYSNTYARVDGSMNFYVGGRANTLSDAVYGAMDLVRVSQGVLATNQFLNAGGYVATTSAVATLAYWKLDSDGASVDASSQVEPRFALGVATNTAPPEGRSQGVAKALLAYDTTPAFVGDPAANAGALRFTNGTALTSGNLGAKLELDKPFTVEGWMKWDGGAERGVQTLAGTRFDLEAGIQLPPVGTASRILYQVPSGWLLSLEKRGSDVAFCIACNTAVTNVYTGTELIIDADLAVLPGSQLAGRWRHVALAYDPSADDDRGRWTLYLDGVAAGAVLNAVSPFFNHESHRFLIGGRAGGAQSFDGLLDCWRVSSGLVNPDDLLYFSVVRGTLIRVQ